MERHAYDLLISLVEHLGGTMTFYRKGYRHGAWEITIGEKNKIFECTGEERLPALDHLYVPKVENPENWKDYIHKLIEKAEKQLLEIMVITGFSAGDADKMAQVIERAKWKFAWRFARTYPHEYTTKDKCSPEDHKALIDCIEKHGKAERFGNTYRKYFYFEDRKYWHMGDPYSENPEDWPNVINRTWVDVRRHADNVKHVWTEEEVELQKRLWEIQLEKSTDRNK